MLLKYTIATNEQKGEAEILAIAIEKIVRRPILFQDQYELQYLLYPDHSPAVYFRNNGNYEVRETRLCLNFVSSGMTVIDVGANIGLYTLLFAKLVTETGQVHTFEAESLNFKRLAQNVALNDHSHVKIHHKAVYSSKQTIELNVYPEKFTAWHTIGNPKLPDPNSGEFVQCIRKDKVEAIRLDDYCAESGISNIDMLKIDVEGAELDVLIGCEQLLKSGKIRSILFEVSLPQLKGMGRSAREIFDFLINSGFKIFSISDHGFLQDEIKDSAERYDNFVAFRDADDIEQLHNKSRDHSV